MGRNAGHRSTFHPAVSHLSRDTQWRTYVFRCDMYVMAMAMTMKGSLIHSLEFHSVQCAVRYSYKLHSIVCIHEESMQDRHLTQSGAD